ncbi:Nuclear hormone receptor E75 [Holothuria leucospilota]|uniref:Nuclear hormone receptor E75 n=1 Tax=Holothuria leucospilota TaxID=206669 RepID=A0A9Q1BZ39_HOLLE|nr:Nuclear hormone receptor E75 [Holothuria leucospilota]
MSCKRLKERASHSSSGLPAKKKCLLTLRQESKTLTNLLSTSGEQHKVAQVNELSNSDTLREDASQDVQEVAAASSFESLPEAGMVEEKEQCPTSLSSLKLVQICDTLQNCDMDFKMDHWGQQKSPPANTAQKLDQENREPNSRLSPSAPRSLTTAEKNRHYYQMQRHQKKKELEVMWRTVNQAHRKSFPTCNIGKRKFKEDQSEKLLVETNHTIEDILEKLSSIIETSYDDVKTFAESIPGFQDFPLGDRNILQQIGGLEVCLLHLACGFDKKTECLKVWDERWLSLEKVYKLSKSSTDFTVTVFFELLFSLADSLHSMPLQCHDVAVFSALLLLPSDLQGIQNRLQVEVLQEKILNCLSGCLISRNRSCFPCLLAQLLMCMPTLRTLSTTFLELTSHKRLTAKS